MCGIAGIVSGRVSALSENLERMKDSIAHRGPDGEGILVKEGCALVHTRLSIVDLAGGSQPMSSHNGRYTITFNGEIYGFKKLRSTLNYVFESDSDTEVLLALYLEFGSAMLDHIKGMFAFAIWDDREKILFCARDRLGEKPFYYATTEQGDFVFASELSAIVESGLVTPTIDPDSIYHYLRKLYVDPGKTIYKNVSSLAPGNSLELSPSDLTVKRYWKFPSVKESVSLSAARDELVSLLDSAVSEQMVADVPLGAFLSGGLDSSTIVSSAVNHTSNLTTLTYRMAGGLDEGDYARSVANIYDTNHIEMWEEHHSLPDLILKMADVYDEPFADSSAIPTYLICEHARKHCKVVLTGDGADELFGGYVDRYRPIVHMLNGDRADKLQNITQFICYKVANKIYPSTNFWQRSVGADFNVTGKNVSEALDSTYGFFSHAELASFGMEKPLVLYDIDLDGTVNDALKIDSSNYMPGDILVKTDRASMANGLELRAPFLDRDVVEFVMSLPGDLKITSSRDKILLREAFESRWPKKVQGRGKQGFGAPVERWLETPAMRAMINDYLGDGTNIRAILPDGLVDKYRYEGGYKAWTLLTLAVWLEKNKAYIH